MIRDYFLLSFKNLRNKKLRSWLTIIGILIGVVAVVALISLGDGLRLAINSQFGISSTEVITVQAGGLTGYGPPGTGVVSPLTKNDVEAIERLNTVERAVPRNIPTIKMKYNDKISIGFAANIPDGEDRKFIYDQIEIKAEAGRLLKDGDKGKIMLGYNFIEDTNPFGKSILPGKTVIINNEKFEVVGIVKKKGSFIFDNVVYLNQDDAEEVADIGDEVDFIVVKVKDKSLMMQAKEDIEKLLRKRRGVREGEENFEVSTPQAALSSVNSILFGVQVFIALIAGISIFVGAIGIINTMTTAVLERKRQIGIMKAIGARNKDIFMQFFIESGLMGLIGGVAGSIIGIIIGYLGTIGINNFVGADVAPKINLALILLTLAGSFLIGSVAGIFPAMRAARQHPVDALRK